MIRALIFDVGGVLMRTVNPVPRRELEQRFGMPPGGVRKVVLGLTQIPLFVLYYVKKISASPGSGPARREGLHCLG